MSRPEGDRVRLRGLRVFARHGALAHERERGQVFVIDVDLGIDLARAGATDDLAATVDYGELAAAVAEVAGGGPRALIEAVAEDVARVVLRDGRVRDVLVTITKPHAPVPVDAEVSVQIHRRQEASR